MKICRTIAELQTHLKDLQREDGRLGLVPTMGALHRGHAVLIERAHSECSRVVVSLFVNPLQFGPNEDYGRYPRAFDADVALCERSGADVVFAPGVSDMYPVPQLTFVDVTQVSERLCGEFRPGHFRGVATVVLKLLNIVGPTHAYFGEKDFQQLCVIRRMVRDLNALVDIVAVPTVRENDGLALSSRNAYLSDEERKAAPILYESLQRAMRLVEAGETEPELVKAEGRAVLAQESRMRIEYFEIVDVDTAQPVQKIASPVRIAAAVWLGRTRLIDNVGASFSPSKNSTR